MTASNPSIGTVPCPIPNCGASCPIKRFASAHARDSGKRKAGKFFFRCPKHGTFGFDGKAEMQEYILEHGTMNGAELPADEPPPPAPVPEPAPPPAREPPKPAPAAAPPKKDPGWGYF